MTITTFFATYINPFLPVIGLILGAFYYVNRRYIDYLRLTEKEWANANDIYVNSYLPLMVSQSILDIDDEKKKEIALIKELLKTIKIQSVSTSENIFGHSWCDITLTMLATDRYIFLKNYLEQLEKSKSTDTLEDIRLNVDNVKLTDYLCCNSLVQKPKTKYRVSMHEEWVNFQKEYKWRGRLYSIHLLWLVDCWRKLKIRMKFLK